MDNIETPEWDKMVKVKQQWLAIEQFIETLYTSEAYIANYQPSYSQNGPSTRDRVLTALNEEEIARFIALHFNIDIDKVDREQAQVLEAYERDNLTK